MVPTKHSETQVESSQGQCCNEKLGEADKGVQAGRKIQK
jgi:hypothetical protein